MGKYEGDDPTLKAAQERADEIEEAGVIMADDVPASDEVPGTGDAVAGDSGEDGDDADDAPPHSASREEWDAYAQSKGLDPEEFGNKEDLIAAVEGL
jgi:hypothetical protein